MKLAPAQDIYLKSQIKKDLNAYLKGDIDEDSYIKCVMDNMSKDITHANSNNQSQHLYEIITKNTEDVIWTMDLNAEFTYISPSIVKLRGVTVEEAMQESIFDTLSPEFIPQISNLVSQAFSFLEKNKTFPQANIQIKQKRKDGTHVWVEMVIKGLYNNDGECVGISGISRNIDMRKKAEIMLKQSEETFKGLFNTIKEAIYIQNFKGEFIEVNKGVLDMYGYERDKFIGRTPEFLSAPQRNDLNALSVAISKAASGEKQEFEFWGRRKTGEVFPKLVSLYPGKYFGENVIIALAKDITEIKHKEDQINNERILLKTIINSAPFDIYIKDTDRKKIISNNKVDTSGNKIDDKLNISANNINCEKQKQKILQDELSVINDGISIINQEECYQLPNKKKIWQMVSKVPWVDDKNEIKGLVGFGMDITAQKRAESMQQMLYKISASAIKSTSLHDLVAAIHEEMDKVIDTSNFLCALYNEDNDTLFAPYFRDEKDELEEWPCNMSLSGYTMKTCKPLQLNDQDILKLKKKGVINLYGSLPKCWISVPLLVDKKPIGALVMQNYEDEKALNDTHKEILELVAHEMSFYIYKKRIETELIKAKEKAIESDKLKSTFLANMSHEIRTPMNAIVGFSELINQHELDDEDRKHYTDIIQQRSHDLLTLIDDILDISKLEVGQVKIINSQFNLKNLLLDLHESYDIMWIQSGKSKLQFNKEILIKDTVLNTDASRVRQIITNLLNNAFKFTMDGHISLGCKKTNAEFIEIYVSDSGPGISKNKQTLIFDRFKQADDIASQKGGAGIGLSISKGLVELLGGSMTLKSVPGNGSVFSFTLPL